jgi:hypothetical protein
VDADFGDEFLLGQSQPGQQQQNQQQGCRSANSPAPTCRMEFRRTMLAALPQARLFRSWETDGRNKTTSGHELKET